MASGEKSSKTALALYSEFLGFTALITAWLTLVGWSYSETYFRLWGIPLSGSGVAAGQLVKYSADIVQRSWGYVVLALGLITLIGMALDFGLRRGIVAGSAMAAALGTIALFGFAGWIGADRARQDIATMRAEAFVGLPRALILLERVPQEDDRRGQALKSDLSERGCYRILFMGDDMLWAVRPRPLNPDGSVSPETPAVLGLPRSEVIAVRLLGHRPNCP